jgi:hypothetical protein
MTETEPEWLTDVSRIAVGDVLRWTEPIWPEFKGRRKRKRGVPPNGEQRITAQVLELDERRGFHLELMEAIIVSNRYGVPLKVFKKHEKLWRKKEKIERGKPERRILPDESARSLTVSRFFEG